MAVMRLHDVCAYEILGLKSGEVYGPGDIRKAFLRATLKAHPDKHEGDDEPWLVLKEAYDVLQDEVHRGIYDTALLNGHDMVCEKFLLYRGKKCTSFPKGVLGGYTPVQRLQALAPAAAHHERRVGKPRLPLHLLRRLG